MALIMCGICEIPGGGNTYLLTISPLRSKRGRIQTMEHDMLCLLSFRLCVTFRCPQRIIRLASENTGVRRENKSKTNSALKRLPSAAYAPWSPLPSCLPLLFQCSRNIECTISCARMLMAVRLVVQAVQ